MKRNASLDPLEALPAPFGPIFGPKIKKIPKIEKSKKNHTGVDPKQQYILNLDTH